MFLFLTVLATVCLSVYGTSVPFIEPCREGDSQCLVRSAKKALPTMSAGVPALGISPLDPLHLGKVHTNNAGLLMEFRNTIIKGLRNSEVLKLERHGKHLELTLKSSLVMAGDYTMSGKLLIMPIEGDGKYRIRIRDMVTKVTFEFGERGVGADAHWTVASWKHSFSVESGADFKFQNLFKGNKQLSEALHQFANSNWREIFQEVAPPMVEKTVGVIVQEITKLFEKVPIRELVKS